MHVTHPATGIYRNNFRWTRHCRDGQAFQCTRQKVVKLTNFHITLLFTKPLLVSILINLTFQNNSPTGVFYRTCTLSIVKTTLI